MEHTNECICGHFQLDHEDVDNGREGDWGKGACRECSCKGFQCEACVEEKKIKNKEKDEKMGEWRDMCKTIILKEVTVQENGIIRNSKGYLIARLCDHVDFESEHLRPDGEEL